MFDGMVSWSLTEQEARGYPLHSLTMNSRSIMLHRRVAFSRPSGDGLERLSFILFFHSAILALWLATESEPILSFVGPKLTIFGSSRSFEPFLHRATDKGDRGSRPQPGRQLLCSKYWTDVKRRQRYIQTRSMCGTRTYSILRPAPIHSSHRRRGKTSHGNDWTVLSVPLIQLECVIGSRPLLCVRRARFSLPAA